MSTSLSLFIQILLLKKLCIPSVNGTSDNPLLTYDSLYKDGVEFYLENNFGNCVKYIEFALEDYHWREENTLRCRKKCYKTANESETIFTPTNFYDHFFEKTVINTLCLMTCKNESFSSTANHYYPPHIEEEFKNFKPYDYLQLCYFKVDRINDAANAAATFLSLNPDHKVMMGNLQYYIKEGGLEVEDLVNLEMKEYGKEFFLGDNAYMDEDFDSAIEHLEKSLSFYWVALDNCRYLCEDQFDHGWYPDFIPSIANHYTYVLRCRQKCISKLDEYTEGSQLFVSTVLNYLQFSYYKMKNYGEACKAIESILYLDPEDSSQNQNRHYLLTHENIKPDYFELRKEVVSFKDQLDKEERLLQFIEQNFVAQNDKDAEVEHETLLPSAVEQKKTDFSNIQILATDEELKGENRILASGFLSPLQCWSLMNLVKETSMEGDGYFNGVNPHTPFERFMGVTLSRVALMIHVGLLKRNSLEELLNVTEFSRQFLEEHFQLKTPLYFSFTHLVCRSSRSDIGNRKPSDLSHEVHVDNCILQPNGDCLKVPPAYTFRDYSAILYLNEDFQGGEFIFSDDRTGANYQSKVQPKCGHLLGFSAGKENPHGVLPVTFGSRCAIGMWFTLEKKHREVEREMAVDVLEKMNKN